MTTKYTRQQVAQHNTDEDLWVVINGNVYDMTDFLHDHPGGPDPLMEMAGKDATELFTSTKVHNNKQITDYLESKMIGCITPTFEK